MSSMALDICFGSWKSGESGSCKSVGSTDKYSRSQTGKRIGEVGYAALMASLH